ncbi:MAG TPA: hypothetical protein VK283_01190 [Acidimicrobiales bacterium]|nr:hypothetical protein [Acidimicrobiales bacterium]
MNQRIAAGLVSVWFGAVLTMATMPSLPAPGLEPDHRLIETAGIHGAAKQSPLHTVPHIVLFGDSLVSEAGQEFTDLATRSGAAVQVHTFPGTSPCNYFTSMATAARDWHPTVAVLAFTGDVFTPCNDGVQVGTAQYYTKYRDEIRTAISIFRSAGAGVVLIGQPADSTAVLTRNGLVMNQLYRSIAKATPGVRYADAGQAVMAKGRFTWTLPCLSGQPCTGPHGTNIVRSPDGVHFCPNGRSTPDRGLEVCDVYSSGAFRFASAMLKAALGSRTGSAR